jgi:uncharacterized protein YbjT (DUF2867 family)
MLGSVESQSPLSLFCADLPSRPNPAVGRVLVTGASGYIGGRLVPELLARGYRVRVMVRAPSPEYATRWPGAEIAIADALKPESLAGALAGVDVAYYLIHSMLLGPREFAEADISAAANFRRAAQEQGAKRIIYLGGLGDARRRLSPHLRSRMAVAEELKRGTVPVTILRAAIIIGSGSASHEIIKSLVRRLPLIAMPPAGKHKCQPIGVRDVIKYLVGVMEIDETSGMSFDIGGPDVLTYEQMMRTTADLVGRKIGFMRLPLLSLRTYAYAASLLTPVPGPITQSLMEGLRNDVVCQDDSIRTYLPFEPLPYREAVVRALKREEQDRVHTRWSDAYPPSYRAATRLDELSAVAPPAYMASASVTSDKDAARIFASICRIGGKEGWFHRNWMWRLRGMADRIMLGVGSSRGRRHHGMLKTDDVVGFWRVEDIRVNQRLLLRAEMKLPGKAWLEFTIADREGARQLSVVAYYHTTTLAGRAYWYVFLPFHNSIFKGLITQIEKRS